MTRENLIKELQDCVNLDYDPDVYFEINGALYMIDDMEYKSGRCEIIIKSR